MTQFVITDVSKVDLQISLSKFVVKTFKQNKQVVKIVILLFNFVKSISLPASLSCFGILHEIWLMHIPDRAREEG